MCLIKSHQKYCDYDCDWSCSRGCKKCCLKESKCCWYIYCCVIIILLIGAITIILTFPNYNSTYTDDCKYGTNKTTICICNKFYTLDNKGECTIKLKSKLTATLLQGFFGFVGGGYMYLGMWIRASIYIFGVLMFILIWYYESKFQTNLGIGYIIMLCLMVILLMWWFISVFLMTNDTYKNIDGNALSDF